MRFKLRFGIFALVAGATLALGAVACTEAAATVTTSSQSPTATPGQSPTSSPTQARSSTPAPGDDGTAATIQNFSLPNLQLTVGTTVTWTNQDGAAHTVTHGTPSVQGDEFGSSSLSQGDTFSVTFDEPGRYDYFCSIHTTMTGAIVVAVGGPDATSTPAPTATSAPAATATLVPVLASPTSTPAVATPTPVPTDPTATPDSGGEQYSAKIEGFAHEDFTIQAGTEVTWTNLDNALHTVSSGTPESPTSEFNSPGITQNQTFTFTFDEPGEYPYFCTPHPFMRGRVIVE